MEAKVKIRAATTETTDQRSDLDLLAPPTTASLRWREIIDGDRIVAQYQVRGRSIAIRGSEPEWSELVRAIGWPVLMERRQATITVPLVLLGRALEIIGHGALETMRRERPNWREFSTIDRAVHEKRRVLSDLLGRASSARNPEEVARGADPQGELFVAGKTLPLPTVPTDHPYHQLRPYQQAGVQLLMGSGLRFALGDDMGLGKTPQTWVSLDLTPDAKKILIVCPKVVARNWMIEGETWAPSITCDVVSTGAKVKAWCEKHRAPSERREALVITWGLLEPCLEALASVSWTSVAADEEHQAKEVTSARSRALLASTYGALHRIGITGTPMLNRPVELFALLHFVDPIAFPRFVTFAERYGAPKDITLGNGQMVREYRGASHEDELNLIVRPYLIRRTKEEVLPDLPPQIEQIIHIECPKSLKDACDEALRGIREMEENALGTFTKLRQQVGLAKVDTAVDWLIEMHARGESVVVFVAHHPVREAIELALDNQSIAYRHIIGETSQKQRQTNKDDFQAGKYPILIGSEAMRDGVTLTRAAHSLHVERWFTPAGEDQAKSRIHRFGQLRTAIHVLLHLDGSLDDWLVDDLLATKDKRITRLHDRSDLDTGDGA